MNKDIGSRLLFLRKRYGWTIQEVADKINKSDATYGGYEKNYRTPNAETLCDLADIFNSTTDFILARTDNPNGFDFDVKDLLTHGKLNWDGRELTDEEAEKAHTIFQLILQRQLD